MCLQNENAEVCALAGTAWCSLVLAMELDLMKEYEHLYSSQRELRLGHVALTAGLLNISKGS